MRIRPYRPEDAAGTLDAFRRAIRVTASADYTAAQVAAWAPDEIDLAAWARRRSATDTRVMFVHPEFGRRGIAERATRALRVLSSTGRTTPLARSIHRSGP
ncbi:hypothetical protein [Frigoribacterium sp. UYMn621]|uniref:hypothetical protein n=1 Tax=Frigoribacterium sp. UYMn621 TaxID=3156343 RepID=UPI00339913A4